MQQWDCLKQKKALFISIQKTRMTVRAIENLKKYARVVTPLKNISPQIAKHIWYKSL